MATVNTRIRRNPFFRNENGDVSTVKDPDDTVKHVFDFADDLPSGETVSSQATTSDGPTVASALATPKVTVTISGSGSGLITCVGTFSGGEIMTKTLRVYAEEPGREDVW